MPNIVGLSTWHNIAFFAFLHSSQNTLLEVTKYFELNAENCHDKNFCYWTQSDRYISWLIMKSAYRLLGQCAALKKKTTLTAWTCLTGPNAWFRVRFLHLFSHKSGDREQFRMVWGTKNIHRKYDLRCQWYMTEFLRIQKTFTENSGAFYGTYIQLVFCNFNYFFVIWTSFSDNILLIKFWTYSSVISCYRSWTYIHDIFRHTRRTSI